MSRCSSWVMVLINISLRSLCISMLASFCQDNVLCFSPVMEHPCTVLSCYGKRHLTYSLATAWLNTTNVGVRKLCWHFINVGGMHTTFPKTQLRTLLIYLRHSIIAVMKFVESLHTSGCYIIIYLTRRSRGIHSGFVSSGLLEHSPLDSLV